MFPICKITWLHNNNSRFVNLNATQIYMVAPVFMITPKHDKTRRFT